MAEYINTHTSEIAPEARLDDDLYEDAGDVDLTSATQPVYLARVPKFFWKACSNGSEEREHALGMIRLEGDLKQPKRLSLLLDEESSINHSVPREFNLQITNSSSSNSIIFTEKDLPGYSNRLKTVKGEEQDPSSLPISQSMPRFRTQDRVWTGSGKVDKGRKIYNSRKAIPKRTAVTGSVTADLNCLPVENENYRRTMEKRNSVDIKPKRETKLLKGPTSYHGSNILHPGTIGSADNFSNFTKPTAAPKAKAQDAKAARIPQNELLDLIHGCFKRYKYWSLKRLKEELRQPEAYLKQTLELVARLVRQGPFAMTWQLKPESQMSAYADVLDAQAPDPVGGLDGASDVGETISDEDEANM